MPTIHDARKSDFGMNGIHASRSSRWGCGKGEGVVRDVTVLHGLHPSFLIAIDRSEVKVVANASQVAPGTRPRVVIA